MSSACSMRRLNIALIVPFYISKSNLLTLIDMLRNDCSVEINHIIAQRLYRPNEFGRLDQFSFWIRDQFRSRISASQRLRKWLPQSEAGIKISEDNFDFLPNSDLVIDVTGFPLDRDILKISRLGVLSLQPGIQDGISARAAVYQRQAGTSFLIALQRENAEARTLLVRGSLRTETRVRKNVKLNLRRRLYYLKYAIDLLADGRDLSNFPKEQGQDTRPQLSLRAIASFYIHALLTSARDVMRLITGTQEQSWHVGIQREKWQNLDSSNSVILQAPQNCFVADPFLIEDSGRQYCFVEEYDRKKAKAHIAVYDISEEPRRLGVALEEPFHLSFPYIFKYGDEIYLIPETAQAREIRLYRCVDFPLRWELKSVLMRDVSAADTMIFPFHGRWWMLTNINPLGLHDHCSELFAFYADAPESSAWQAHRQNPIIIDPACARNGGMMTEGDALYRVAQEQRFGEYGAACSIRRIVTLDPDHFQEDIVRPVRSEDRMALRGIHHISAIRDMTAFDFNRSK